MLFANLQHLLDDATLQNEWPVIESTERTPKRKSLSSFVGLLGRPQMSTSLRQLVQRLVTVNTEIDKFKYLLTYLTGAAKAAIQGIRLAEANYDIAVNVLSDRFGRRGMLVNDHLDHLLSLAPVRSSSELSKLRILHDEVTFRMNALEGLGVCPGEYGAVPRRVLLKALPSDFSILYRQREKEALPPDNAAASPADQADQSSIEIREESGFGETTSFTSKRHLQREFRGPELQLPTAAASSAEVRFSYSRPCLLCNSAAHTIRERSAPFPQEEQSRRIQAGNLCFRCAKGKNFASEGRRARSLQCRRCPGPHLTSICDINHITNRSCEPTLRSSNTSAPREQAPESIVTQCRATSVSTSSAGLTPVLLQTGRAWAIAPAKTILIMFLLYSGSQRSFVWQDIARALNCPV
ncbi:hypothetical protein HPB50_026542 [Hyalomma asiaticum]|uniref:Uncharacterized protein n=1 Tax=Hyalomma asiaticum TaxID=266040 RepID=A0ACB7TP14_HYAAI|nr:hypothetical protein HPB50_026542 [Hyalomma asiaticum]